MGKGRVLQLAGPSTGGIRRHVVALQDRLAARDWEVDVAGPAGVLDGLGRLDHVVEVPARTQVRRAQLAVRQLRRIVESFDVVHAHGLKAGWVAVLAGGRPLVVTVHNVVLPELHGPQARLRAAWEGAVQQALPRRVDAVIATSADVARRLARSSRTGPAVVVAPFGPAVAAARGRATVRHDLGVRPEAPLVVGAGRLHAQKGWPVLLAATAMVRESVEGVRVVVVGEGPQRAELEWVIGQHHLEATAQLVGPSDDVAGVLAAADVVAVPSRWESGPLVVAEAMSLGRPVVATPVGFVPDLVEDGVSGQIVPVGDVVGLASALVSMLTDGTAAERMGARGRERVQAVLDPERLTDEVEAVYRRVRERS